jgi:hypothetical protein
MRVMLMQFKRVRRDADKSKELKGTKTITQLPNKMIQTLSHQIMMVRDLLIEEVGIITNRAQFNHKNVKVVYCLS